MRIKEAKDCIKELYLNTASVTALISERGIGKTSAYQQCAKELGIGYIGLYAAALEGPDFMGLPDKDREKGITRYLAPQFLPTEAAVREGLYQEKGLLVLEEINRVPSDTVSVLYPLLLEKKINGHQIASGWSIGITMNPDTMNYLVNSLDDAMLDRFISIEITADLGDYIDYSLQNHPHDDVLSFLEACPELLLVVKKAAESNALSKYPTPRGWTKVQELLNNCSLETGLMKELIAGIVGPQAAASFYGYLNHRDLKIPASDQLLADYSSVRGNIMDLLGHNHFDRLNYLIRKLVLSFDGSETQLRNLDRFLMDLPEELQLLFFKTFSLNREKEMELIAGKSDCFDRIIDKMIDVVN